MQYVQSIKTWLQYRKDFLLWVLVLPVILTVLIVMASGWMTNLVEVKADMYEDRITYHTIDGMACIRVDFDRFRGYYALTCNWETWDGTIDGTVEPIVPKS